MIPTFNRVGATPQLRYTVKEASGLYNIPKWKFWRAIRLGLLPCERLLNGRIYLRAADIEAALSQNVEGNNGK